MTALPEDLAGIPVMAQIAIVNKVVLPLLDKMNVNVTVTPNPKGLRLDLEFREPQAKPGGEHVFGTDTPDEARQLWALRERVEEERRKRGLDNAN